MPTVVAWMLWALAMGAFPVVGSLDHRLRQILAIAAVAAAGLDRLYDPGPDHQPHPDLRAALRPWFWHTFTIDELHVDLEAPLGGTREASFTPAPGRYRFYCRVPAHAAAGMRGTLTIRRAGLASGG